MAPRYIDADALKDRLRWGWVNDKFVLRKIDEAPAIDAVLVVRCKDCKYYNTAWCNDGCGWCERDGDGYGSFDDWFCAGGRRKNETD